MNLILAFVVIGSFATFYAGYYFGNQMGRTESIRNHLAEARKQQSD
ncbi:MAG: hypothetical protein OQK73_02005 [Gammaproteobacteria bacterium]|nr:hypothetical protein [Gammaproteobacteria bacterium]